MNIKLVVVLILGAIIIYFLFLTKKEHMTSNDFDNFKQVLLTEINTKVFDENIIKEISNAYTSSQAITDLANRLPTFQNNILKYLDKDMTEQLYFNLRMLITTDNTVKNRMISMFLLMNNIYSLGKLGNFTLDEYNKNIVKLLLIDYATNGKFTLTMEKLPIRNQ
jgi:hypothetical protein